MKVRVGVEMLATLVVLFLALGASDGVVMNKCELGDELNTTLPANLLDQITNLLAKIVCHVELSSHFNTSTINHVIGPNVHSFIRGGRGGRKGRSAESSTEESSEEDSDSSNGAGRRKRSRSRLSSEESSEEDIKVPKPNFNSSTVHPVTYPQGNNSSSRDGHRGRKGRSAESSTEESSEEDSDSSNGEGRQKRSRSRSSSEESNERNMWTLYGLFQLPDRITCTSGSEPSLNLCSMACDSLIDDNIRDDIACVETILNNMLSAANSPGPTKALFSKLYADFFQKECKNVEDFEYFSTC